MILAAYRMDNNFTIVKIIDMTDFQVKLKHI